MFVCLCNALSDDEIRRAAGQGHMTVDAAYRALGAKVKCGRCRPMAGDLIQEANPFSARDGFENFTAGVGCSATGLAAE